MPIFGAIMILLSVLYYSQCILWWYYKYRYSSCNRGWWMMLSSEVPVWWGEWWSIGQLVNWGDVSFGTVPTYLSKQFKLKW